MVLVQRPYLCPEIAGFQKANSFRMSDYYLIHLV